LRFLKRRVLKQSSLLGVWKERRSEFFSLEFVGDFFETEKIHAHSTHKYTLMNMTQEQEEDTSFPQPKAKLEYYPSSLFWLFAAPAIGGFLFGYDIGGTSYAILQLASQEYSDSPFSLEDAPLKTGWFVSAPSGGALVGSAVLLWLDQQHNIRKSVSNSNAITSKPAPIGRKQELVWAGILYAIGGLLQYLAAMVKTSTKWPFWLFLLGRWIYGAGIGFSMHGGPIYLAETTPPSVRGIMVGAKEIAIVKGIMVGYGVGEALCRMTAATTPTMMALTTYLPSKDGWACIYAVSVPVAITMIAFAMVLPESPRYLLSSHGRRKPNDELEFESEREQRISSEILESLRFVWKPKRALEEHRRLMEVFYAQRHQQQNVGETYDSKKGNLVALFSDVSVRPALRAGLGLVILQQITGHPTVMSYATPILARVPGLSTSSTILMASFKGIVTSLSVLVVERYGRKYLLWIGCSLMLAALTVLVVAFRDDDFAYGDDDDDDDDVDDVSSSLDIRSFLTLAGMFVYIAGYQIGFGPITWLMISEVFPQSVRGTATALAVQANFALNGLVQLLVPIVETTLGMSWTFGIFGCLTAYSMWFVKLRVPETRGLTLEEIEDKLALLVVANRSDRHWCLQSMYLDSTEENSSESERTRLLPPPEC